MECQYYDDDQPMWLPKNPPYFNNNCEFDDIPMCYMERVHDMDFRRGNTHVGDSYYQDSSNCFAYEDQRSFNFEDVMLDFIKSQHETNEFLKQQLQQVQSGNEKVQRIQQDSIQNLENEVDRLYQIMSEEQTWSLPDNTESQPDSKLATTEHVNEIGTTMDNATNSPESVINSNVVPIVQVDEQGQDDIDDQGNTSNSEETLLVKGTEKLEIPPQQKLLKEKITENDEVDNCPEASGDLNEKINNYFYGKCGGGMQQTTSRGNTFLNILLVSSLLPKEIGRIFEIMFTIRGVNDWLTSLIKSTRSTHGSHDE